mmetsp:Transcript_3450/g.11489  ORF Transcript_3450/g.11489 Transcript_3450/m.11489 type:complete len:172 (-) Transcript_3450:244-759(-)
MGGTDSKPIQVSSEFREDDGEDPDLAALRELPPYTSLLAERRPSVLSAHPEVPMPALDVTRATELLGVLQDPIQQAEAEITARQKTIQEGMARTADLAARADGMIANQTHDLTVSAKRCGELAEIEEALRELRTGLSNAADNAERLRLRLPAELRPPPFVMLSEPEEGAEG